MLYGSKKNPVELKHCETSSSCRVFYLMKLKPEKESYYLILEYDYVTWKPRIGNRQKEARYIYFSGWSLLLTFNLLYLCISFTTISYPLYLTLISRMLHNYNARLSSKMTNVIPQVRTNYGIFNIRFQDAEVWNDISDDIKLLALNILKKNLKLILLEKY